MVSEYKHIDSSNTNGLRIIGTSIAVLHKRMNFQEYMKIKNELHFSWKILRKSKKTFESIISTSSYELMITIRHGQGSSTLGDQGVMTLFLGWVRGLIFMTH